MDLRIYNLFPRLFTGIDAWLPVAQDAKRMGFNAIYLNPFFETGSSGSIYSIVDYYNFDYVSTGNISWDQCVEKVREFCAQCRAMDMEIIFDLVINHTAIDSSLCIRHPDWYVCAEDGSIQSPFAYEISGNKVVWEDCAKLSYAQGARTLWDYIVSVCRFYIDLGATGFRCDVACHLPNEFWKYLIRLLREKSPDVLFLGEAFLASQNEIAGLANAGFNYVFNSARWWDFSQRWLPEQINALNDVIATISFPDNHDTERILAELRGNLEQCRQRLTMLALLSSGFMITSGFEYGFQKRLDVKATRPEDWEATGIDLRKDIAHALALRAEYPVFREDGILELLSPENADILALKKTAGNQQALIIANRTAQPFAYYCKAVGILFSLEKCGAGNSLTLAPYEIKLFVLALQEKNGNVLGENQSFCLERPGCLVKKTVQLKPLQPGEALVEIQGCGICGSDYQEFRQGRFFWPASGTGGHEFIGIVRQLCPPAYGIKPSQSVVYRIPRQGTGIVQGGGFSRFAVVRSQCLHALEALDDPKRMILTEPLASAVHAGRMAGSAKTIAVLGSGTIALLLLRYLSMDKPKAELSLYFKHSHILPYLPENVSAYSFSELAAPPNPYTTYPVYDLIYECSGTEEAALRALRALRTGGRLVLTGVYRGESKGFPFSNMMFQEKQLQGSFLYTRKDFLKAMALLRSGTIRGEDIIKLMPFESCQEAFSLPSDHRIKTVIWNDEL